MTQFELYKSCMERQSANTVWVVLQEFEGEFQTNINIGCGVEDEISNRLGQLVLIVVVDCSQRQCFAV